MPRAVLQLIETEWDKSSRGGEGAALRARVPAALPLPPELMSRTAGGVMVHRVRFCYTNGFQKPIAVSVEDLPFDEKKGTFEWGCVEIEPGEGELVVRYLWSTWEGGAPKRSMYDAGGKEHPLRKQAFTLQPDQWGRLEYNGRFADVDTGHWHYRQTRANVAFVEAIDPDLFAGAEPPVSHRELADLW